MQPTQCNGSGWAAGRSVGSLGRTPTVSQKLLMGKNGKSCYDKQYKAIGVNGKEGEQWQKKER